MSVENYIIVELKAAECLYGENEYQLINYLKATEYEVGLLLNFGQKTGTETEGFFKTLKQKIIIKS